MAPLQPILDLHEVGELETDPRNPGDDEVLDQIELEADADGEIEPIARLADMPQCVCRWFRAWQLPCWHIWLHHFCFNSLQPAHFIQLFELWANNGFEVYEEISRPFAEALDEIDGMPDKPRLEIKEVNQQINAKAWEVMAFMRENGATRCQTERAVSIYTARVRESNS
jgi:hypothetical protein